MKKNNLALIIILLSVSFACKPKVSFQKVTTFYGIVNSSFTSFHDISQKAVDFETDALLKVKADNNAVIDTKRMRLLIDSARQASQSRLAMLKSVHEIDSEITLKNKALIYDELFYSAYNYEFRTALEVFESNKDKKFEIISDILKPKFLKIKEAELAYKEADKAFQEKYDIKFVEPLH
jgi:hypothetical protein